MHPILERSFARHRFSGGLHAHRRRPRRHRGAVLTAHRRGTFQDLRRRGRRQRPPADLGSGPHDPAGRSQRDRATRTYGRRIRRGFHRAQRSGSIRNRLRMRIPGSTARTPRDAGRFFRAARRPALSHVGQGRRSAGNEPGRHTRGGASAGQPGIFLAKAVSEALPAIRERLAADGYPSAGRSGDDPLIIPAELLGGARLAVFATGEGCSSWNSSSPTWDAPADPT